MSGRDHRPICDTWILARPKVAYHGAYPSGFLERARNLLGVRLDEPVLHVCSGRVRDYPFRGVGKLDATLDVDPSLGADFTSDVTREPPPEPPELYPNGWPAVMTDPPYTEEDAQRYATTADLPSPDLLLRWCVSAVQVGGRVGMLHYVIPRPPANARPVAYVGVMTGFGCRMRAYTVFEKTEPEPRKGPRRRT